MTRKQSKARKKDWKKLTEEQRSERMRHAAKSKHAKLTKKQRSAHAKRMIAARWKKQA